MVAAAAAKAASVGAKMVISLEPWTASARPAAERAPTRELRDAAFAVANAEVGT